MKSIVKNIRFSFVVITLLLFFVSCNEEPVEPLEERQDRIEEAVEQRLADRKIERLKECKRNALVIAEKRVDSILLAEAKLLTKDSVIKPDVPIKPATPTIMSPKDSTPVEPLFEEKLDTLN